MAFLEKGKAIFYIQFVTKKKTLLLAILKFYV